MRPHYDVLIDVLVREGIGYRNPLFDRENPSMEVEPVQPEQPKAPEAESKPGLQPAEPLLPSTGHN